MGVLFKPKKVEVPEEKKNKSKPKGLKVRKEEVKKNAFSLENFYDIKLIDKIYKKANFQTLETEGNLAVFGDTVFTKDGYMRYYNIVAYPEEFPYSEVEGFISILLNSLKTRDTAGVDFFFERYNRPYVVKFNKKIKDRYEGFLKIKNKLEEQIEKYDDPKRIGSRSRTRELERITPDVARFRLTEVNKKIKSYQIIKYNQGVNKTQIQSYQFIRMFCRTKDLLDAAEENLISRFTSYDVKLKKVDDALSYLQAFSPISGLTGATNTNFASVIFTTDAYSKLRSKPTRIMENELVNISRLIYVGTEISNNEPLGISITSSGKGQNMVVIGGTGSGKTYFYFNFLMNAALMDFKLNVMCYKGKEYDNIIEVLPNTVKLDFSLNSEYFVNTMKFIPELYDKSEWKSAFIRNTDFTIRSLIGLAGINKEDKLQRAYSIIENLVKNIYTRYRVFIEDPNSYFKTKDIDYFAELSKEISQLQSNQFIHRIYGEELCREIYVGLTPYFSLGSHKSTMFKREINLQEVIEKDCILYSYNMNEDSDWGPIMDYKITTHDFITNLFVQRNKKRGFTTLNSFEEYQRVIRNPIARKIYNDKFSGGRSDNVVNTIMTNTLQPLLDSSSLDLSAIRENISNVVIGPVQDLRALDEFCHTYALEPYAKSMIDKVQKIGNHVFYIDYNTGVQRGGKIIKVIHPEWMQRYFETKRIDRRGEY